jgi:hypothetical protein
MRRVRCRKNSGLSWSVLVGRTLDDRLLVYQKHRDGAWAGELAENGG